MRVGIGLSGEGRGHAARIGVLARELSNHHDLVFWAPKTVHSFFKTVHPPAKLYEIPHMKIVRKKFKVAALATAFANVPLWLSKKKVNRIREELRNEKIQAVIADYDPLMVKAAKKEGIPVLWFGHQPITYKFSKLSIPYIHCKIAHKFMMPHYDHVITSSFFDGDVGPLLRNELFEGKTKKKDHVWVYAKKQVREQIEKELQGLDQNLRFFPSSKHNDVESLKNCKAIIATSGHQLTSEAVSLGKPFLLIPEEGQYEQWVNAKAVENIGLGKITTIKNLKRDAKELFENLHNYEIHSEHDHKLIKKDDTASAISKINEFLESVR